MTLTADMPAAGPVVVTLADVLGRVIRREKAAAPAGEWHYAVPTTGLTPGVYVVRLALPGGGTASRRLVVNQ